MTMVTMTEIKHAVAEAAKDSPVSGVNIRIDEPDRFLRAMLSDVTIQEVDFSGSELWIYLGVRA